MSDRAAIDFVLDSWAVLAFLDGEPGGERVRQLFLSAQAGQCSLGLSLINLGEVAYVVERERGLMVVHEVLSWIKSLPVTILPAGESEVLAAAHLKAHNRLAYADAVAAATAVAWGARLVTGDPEFLALENKEITLEWIGPLRE